MWGGVFNDWIFSWSSHTFRILLNSNISSVSISLKQSRFNLFPPEKLPFQRKKEKICQSFHYLHESINFFLSLFSFHLLKIYDHHSTEQTTQKIHIFIQYYTHGSKKSEISCQHQSGWYISQKKFSLCACLAPKNRKKSVWNISNKIRYKHFDMLKIYAYQKGKNVTEKFNMLRYCNKKKIYLWYIMKLLIRLSINYSLDLSFDIDFKEVLTTFYDVESQYLNGKLFEMEISPKNQENCFKTLYVGQENYDKKRAV